MDGPLHTTCREAPTRIDPGQEPTMRMADRSPNRPPRVLARALTVGILVGALSLATLGAAIAEEHGAEPDEPAPTDGADEDPDVDAPAGVGIDAACPPSVQQLALFPDVEPGTHFAAINCIRYYGLTSGLTSADAPGGRIYEPHGQVTRGQMASFISATVEFLLGERLPATSRFDDDAVVHQAGIRKLATAGIVRGIDADTYAPGRPVTRGQMASFVAGAIEFVLDVELSVDTSFPDVNGVHRTNIDKLATAGVVSGLGDGTYGPDLPVSREQMASFIALSISLSADRGVFPQVVRPVDGNPSTLPRSQPAEPGPLGVTGLRLGSHTGFDRMILDIGGDGQVGWDIRYVDEAIDPATGETIEVTGRRLLRIAVTGLAAPADLPDDLTLWDGSPRAGADGALITEVVGADVRNGVQVFHVGTSGQLPFVVARPLSPQRLVVDIFRGFRPVAPPTIEPPLPDPQIVSSFTTPLTPGQSRNTNIRQAASIIDGDVIPPGATYSLDSAIGPRTRARGFVANGFISGGDVISVVGGGISQVATTFLNAAWFAGIELTEFRQHSIYFTRYPMCREATIATGSIDLRIRNDSPHDITIRASASDQSVTISFVSIPWADVASWTGTPFDVQGTGRGFSVSCGRTVTYPDDTTSTDRYTWRYTSGFPG